MFRSIRHAIIAMTARAQQYEEKKLVRKGRGLAAALVRTPADIKRKLESFASVAEHHERETSSWVKFDDYLSGTHGPFDACDLRFWLALADECGVEAVAAREILRLSEDEMSSLSGEVNFPDDRITSAVRRRLVAALGPLSGDIRQVVEEGDVTDMMALEERLYDAMDDVPNGWMVRSARCGSIELKSLAGSGVAGGAAPEVKFGNDLEIGPGWVRNGNRRRVHVSDARTVAQHAEGPGDGAVFLARPWVEAARYFVGPDPHRHGTPFAGKGMWPAEWRAFVENGCVVGVSSYYGWCGEVSAENAAMAIEVRGLAQRIVNRARDNEMFPRYMDVEFARASEHPSLKSNTAIQESLALFGRETVSCTLDFIEVKDRGLMLLEGGPAHTPFGGGHPCSFAGCGGKPTFGNKADTHGVAFKLMPHVVLADPSTWDDGDRSGCILSWEDVQDLARQHGHAEGVSPI